MKCPICSVEIPHWDKDKVPAGHLVVSKSALDDHIHVHGDLDNKPLMTEFIEVAKSECKIEKPKGELIKNEYVFHNRQRIGDILTFTSAVRDFKAAFPHVRVNVISTAGHIWDHNPNIDRTLVPTVENTIKIGPGKLTNSSNRIDWHMCNAFRISMEDALNIHIPQGESRPDIWLSEDEYNAPRVIDKPYWIICVNGELGWGCKMYPFERWQEFVKQNPDVTFCQIGTAEDNPPRLQGANVIDYVGKTQSKENGIRDLFKLFLNAEGSIGLVSFHMHLSGALYKPAIVVAGAREPVSFTQYPGHRYLSTDGALPCGVNACWHCSIDSCSNLVKEKEKVPKCVDIITPEDLTRALNLYYIGGRLDKKVPSQKPKLKNVVKAAPIISTPKAEIVIEKPYGLAFGGGCITALDWEFIRETMDKYEIKTVLEFGTGLSTLLMGEKAKVKTFETMPGWIERIKGIKPDVDINLWDGKNLKIPEQFDMAFVDGPAGGVSREMSTKIASESADVIIVHDANREWERKWQDIYLKGGFSGPVKGGNRCHLWVRTSTCAEKEAVLVPQEAQGEAIAPGSGKHIKFVSTARGWGGCARSITTIMKMLLQAGHRVEFIPFRNAIGSREFQQCVDNELKGLKVSLEYNSVKEHCDVFVVYGDDYIWEFNQPKMIEVFSGINADKKIMVLNYRRGGVGEVEWTRNWDKYLFLNSTQERELLKVNPGVKTRVLAPCTDLSDFLKIEPDYNTNLKIVRHNSQGDTKFARDFQVELQNVLDCRKDVELKMMPGPSFVPANERFIKFTRNSPPIPQFLGLGNLFWYSLPRGYMDMGPRVILEAMAAGLPILADNWGGAVDRVTPETGWLCNSKEEMVEIIRTVNAKELEEKGRAAKERARKEFVAENWREEIVNG